MATSRREFFLLVALLAVGLVSIEQPAETEGLKLKLKMKVKSGEPGKADEELSLSAEAEVTEPELTYDVCESQLAHLGQNEAEPRESQLKVNVNLTRLKNVANSCARVGSFVATCYLAYHHPENAVGLTGLATIAYVNYQCRGQRHTIDRPPGYLLI